MQDQLYQCKLLQISCALPRVLMFPSTQVQISQKGTLPSQQVPVWSSFPTLLNRTCLLHTPQDTQLKETMYHNFHQFTRQIKMRPLCLFQVGPMVRPVGTQTLIIKIRIGMVILHQTSNDSHYQNSGLRFTKLYYYSSSSSRVYNWESASKRLRYLSFNVGESRPWMICYQFSFSINSVFFINSVFLSYCVLGFIAF